ncbi:hypothetical protein [Paenibacillus tarimensis]|nr:hypothetical protein [Paenibacillus tarimensis]MCF2943779.1 hypothetical protein [Paenibacillus tarimensis]
MAKKSNRNLQQKMQSMQAESRQAEESTVGYTKPTIHADKHEPNRPSI